MALSPGTVIGKYEVLEPLGAGGMGEVWKARDTSLQRDVAIKILPDAFADDAQRVARFEREAKLLASLNHPNIAGVHGLEKSGGTSFLELELVEGQTLHDFLQAGPAPVDVALKIAAQIAEALEAAHAKGVVHRDLKPGNVMLTPEGDVKVLDFGLAKSVPDGISASSAAPGATASMTREGALLGTPPYMSPEQVRGGPVDAQTDIWAFGCILFELLTGWSPFAQARPMETLGKVLEREPALDALPAETPALIRRLIRRCLEKDRKDRLHHIGDARIDIREALASPTSPSEGPSLGAARPGRRRWAWPLATITLVVIAAAAAAFVTLRSVPDARREPARYAAGPPVPAPLVAAGNRIVAIAADGAQLAYTSAGTVWLQTVGRQDARPITQSTRTFGTNPFFSPDGEWVGLLSEGKLIKTSVFEGVPITITEPRGGRYTGATWHDDTIIFATQTGLYRVSANQEGGDATLLLEAPDDQTYAWPQFMPNGKSLLLTRLAGYSINDAAIVLLDLETAELTGALARGAVGARYVAQAGGSGGYIVYATERNRLAARAFDPRTRTVGSVPIDVPDVQVRVAGTYLSAAFDVSDTGTLVHIPPRPPARNRLAWVDYEGNEEPVDAELPGSAGYPRISPAGDRVAFDIGGGTPGRRIWTMELDRGVPVQLSDSGNPGPVYEDFQAQWSRDGERIYFTSTRSGTLQIWSDAAVGSGTDERLVDNPDVIVPLASTRDGGLLVMSGSYPAADIGLLDTGDPISVDWLIETPFSEVTPSLSPDERWMAYASNELGDRYEIYVQSFPSGESKTRVSRNGGAYPLWGLEGSGELYYFSRDESGDPALMAATLELSPRLSVTGERVLFRKDYFNLYTQPAGLRPYDISPIDGRFLITMPGPDAANDEMTIWLTLNWTEGLR